MLRDIEKAKKDLNLERERTDITDKYWKKVEEGRRHFQVNDNVSKYKRLTWFYFMHVT